MKWSELSLLKLWLALTAAIVGSFFIWNFVPVLIPFAVVVLALALLTAGIRALAHYAARRFGR